jgi:hypothetical protein
MTKSLSATEFAKVKDAERVRGRKWVLGPALSGTVRRPRHGMHCIDRAWNLEGPSVAKLLKIFLPPAPGLPRFTVLSTV